MKILFALNYTKNKSIILDLNKNPEYLFIVEKLKGININKIYPIFDNSAQSLYGIYGKSGVVILTTENRQLAKEIKKLLFKTIGSINGECLFNFSLRRDWIGAWTAIDKWITYKDESFYV